jgi:hypothetical protein
MEEDHGQPIDPRPQGPQGPQPRPFVYRSAEPDTRTSHPMRRSTDTPRAFRGIAGELCPRTILLKWRVYLKLN